MQNNEMFTGLKVVELASVLAGPSVGQFFTELGAEVIKVENLKTGGDVTRTWRGKHEGDNTVTAYFTSVNWGKKSLAIDLSKEEGKDIVYQLATKADIIIASYKPGDAEKLGVDYATLAKQNASLIYGQITGYGPDNERVGYDAVIQAESGFMDLNGEPGGVPLKMPVALIDVLAGHHLKEGLLLALLKKERTGEGGLVEVSLIQAAITSLSNQATNWLVTHQLPVRQGSAHPNIAPYGDTYITKDQKIILVAIGSDRQFRDLCQVLGLTELASNSKYATNSLRVKNREALNLELQSGVSHISTQDFMNGCQKLKIPAGIIQNLKEVFEMDEAKEILIHGAHLKGVRNVISNSNGKLPDVSNISAPPLFGQHSEEILRNTLTLSPEQIAILRKNKVIN
ncbi:MAG TPA: CaiB/BaiF CoA-transferase family protein [Cyclobacteriaceae bacterium]|nr:CoA transferase [Cyclobacteriaceae bacterium]HRK55076.1 CaiB/BaiF CoA-transferase family protein [Cyclobacteriaceae bacterium]